MNMQIKLNNTLVCYQLEYKKVKNINLRIKSDGKVYVSAHKRVPLKIVEEFMISKAEFILNALKKYESASKIPMQAYFSETEIKDVINGICKNVYPYYEKMGIKYPVIKFRKMTSRWGSCQPKKCILTFNTELRFTPFECIRYVVLHEFTHFLQANHSCKFYEELSKVCPDWDAYRKQMKEIVLMGNS